MQRDHIQDFNFRPILDNQTLNEIELIKFCQLRDDLWQIPAKWRRQVALTHAVVQRAIPLEDVADCAYGRQRTQVAPFHLSVDGGSAELAEVTLFFQLTAQLKRLTLDFRAGAVGHFVRYLWLVTEISTRQTLAFGALHPSLHGRRRSSVLGCDLTQRLSSTYPYDHFAPLLLKLAFLVTLITSMKCFLPCYCNGGACTWL